MFSWIAQSTILADAWSMHDADVGFGWWLVMMLGMVVFWGAVIAVVVWMLRGAGASRPESRPPREATPRDVLDRRLAEGALDVDEYERRRRLLGQAGDDARATPTPTGVGADR